MSTIYKLDDAVIANIAKTLQLALLTGTDIVDNLRRIELQENTEGTLKLSDNYVSNFEHWVAKMLDELESLQSQDAQEEVQVEQLGLFD